MVLVCRASGVCSRVFISMEVTKTMNKQEIRDRVLDKALYHYSETSSPQEIVEAAKIFEKYLLEGAHVDVTGIILEDMALHKSGTDVDL